MNAQRQMFKLCTYSRPKRFSRWCEAAWPVSCYAYWWNVCPGARISSDKIRKEIPHRYSYLGWWMMQQTTPGSKEQQLLYPYNVIAFKIASRRLTEEVWLCHPPPCRLHFYPKNLDEQLSQEQVEAAKEWQDARNLTTEQDLIDPYLFHDKMIGYPTWYGHCYELKH